MPRRIGVIVDVARTALLGGLIFFLAAHTSVTAQSDQGIFELRCRGGQDLFVFGDATIPDVDLSIAFGWTLQGFRPDGTGLEPGTCGWLDRLYREGEPSQIEVSVGGTRAAVLEALDDPDRYWSFWVFNTNQGYLRATRNGAPASDVGVVTRRPDSDLVLTTPDVGVVARPDSDDHFFVGIHNVLVEPRTGGAAISFEALPGQTPSVTISQMVRVPRGVGDPGMEPQVVARIGATQTPIVQGALATYAATISQLAQKEEHRYEITVSQTGNGRPVTETGNFTTLARRARVSVTAFHILDDGDDLSSGDLSFHVIANPGEPTQQVTQVRDGNRTVMEWDSGRTYNVDHEFYVERAPSRLRLVVAGQDDDDGLLPGCLLAFPGQGDPWAGVWDRISSSDRITCQEFNYARLELNVGDAAFGELGDDGWRISRLNMQSLRPNRDVSLEFQVRGWVAVTEE